MPPSESESDDDCYGNNAIKLQNLKNNYRAKRPDITTVDNITNIGSPISVLSASASNTSTVSADNSIINLLEEVPSVSDLPQNVVNDKCTTTKKRITRASRFSHTLTDTLLEVDAILSRRGHKRKNIEPLLAETCPSEVVQPTHPAVNALPPRATVPRGQGARRNQRSRTRSRARGRGSIPRCCERLNLGNCVVYSVGNTDEYPDELENVPIFNKQPDDSKVIAVEDTDLNNSLSEGNEELSVKVYWQQSEYVKFNIRQFQKLLQIFEFFGKRESVSFDKLLFTLKGRILRPEDTPDSIDYNIGLFIDGGIVNSSISNISGSNSKKEKNIANGIMLKFQCQNVKRPFETTVQLDQKLSIAMIKCAEHFELPYVKLRFMLDGDTVSAGSTPVELGLDNGDCIDVNTIS